MWDGRTREQCVPQDGSENMRYFFSDLRVLQLQKIYRTRDRTAVRGLVGGRLPPTSTGNRCTVGSHWYGVLVHIRTAVLVLDGWKQYT